MHFATVAMAFLTAALAERPPGVPPRPSPVAGPFNTGRQMPPSPARSPTRFCRPQLAPSGSCAASPAGRDDAAAVLQAFRACNNGGTVVLDGSYLIASPLDLTFLRAVDVVITGTVAFDDSDVYYWHRNSFKYQFQNQSTFWKLGGIDVNIYGDPERRPSVIDGRGQRYWEALATDPGLLRPMLLALDGAHGVTVSRLRMRNPPNWFNLIANSSDVLVSDMDLRAEATGGAKIANSDGWDTYRSEHVTIQDSFIINTDDCVSFKPNSSRVLVQGLTCRGASHGISVGSLGQYPNKTDIVEHVYVYNTTMSNATDGARIKVWPGAYTDFQETLVGGGGLGWVRNVTYDGFWAENIDRVITITQCYGQKNRTICEEHPANLTIEDVTLKNFKGSASKLRDPEAGTLVCSAPDRCTDIRAENISITVPSGKTPSWECVNMDNSLLQLNCTGANGGERDTGSG